MGIDVKDVTTLIHYGQSYNVETYLQESGGAGQGSQDHYKSVIFYFNITTNLSNEAMVDFVKEKSKCRIKMFLGKFDVDTSKLPPRDHPHPLL